VRDWISQRTHTSKKSEPDSVGSAAQEAIHLYFDEDHNDGDYVKFDDLKPIVSTTMNFDEVRTWHL
jgi:hypothetical protein